MEQLWKLNRNRTLQSYFCQSISPWFALKGKRPGMPNPLSMQPSKYTTQLWKTCMSVRRWDFYCLIYPCCQHHQQFTWTLCMPWVFHLYIVTLVTSEASILQWPTLPHGQSYVQDFGSLHMLYSCKFFSRKKKCLSTFQPACWQRQREQIYLTDPASKSSGRRERREEGRKERKKKRWREVVARRKNKKKKISPWRRDDRFLGARHGIFGFA